MSDHAACLRPCPATFERLAKEAPELLIAWVQTGYQLDAADLSFACEQIGQLPAAERPRLDYDARIALMYRLEHESPIVREGAVYGLAALGGGEGAMFPTGLMHDIATKDPSPGVREAARDALDTCTGGPLVDWRQG